MVLSQEKIISKLAEEVERLKGIVERDSKTSSKPPSSDLIKRSEKKAESETGEEKEEKKRKAGGQPGHKGKTHKGFGRVDRYEKIEVEVCPECGGNHWEKSEKTRKYQNSVPNWLKAWVTTTTVNPHGPRNVLTVENQLPSPVTYSLASL